MSYLACCRIQDLELAVDRMKQHYENLQKKFKDETEQKAKLEVCRFSCGFSNLICSEIILLKNVAISNSSEVERSLMVQWVIRSILHGVDPLSYFSFQPVLHDWCNKGPDMCYPVCGMVHIKEPLLLIDKSSLCGGSKFPFTLSEWSLTICLMPYNCR